MAALLESLLLKKTDIKTVLDWLKNVKVGRNWYRAHTSETPHVGLRLPMMFYEMTWLATDCKQNF